MDKKIILVLLILLVLAIYYCYTHEKFTEIITEKFESGGVGTDTTKAITDLGNIAKQLLAGGATVPGNLTVNGTTTLGGPLVFKNEVWNTSGDGKKRFFFGNNDNTYFGTGSKYVWRNPEDKDIATLWPDGGLVLNCRGKSFDIGSELDAIKASIAALQASTIKVNDNIKLTSTSDVGGSRDRGAVWIASCGKDGGYCTGAAMVVSNNSQLALTMSVIRG